MNPNDKTLGEIAADLAAVQGTLTLQHVGGRVGGMFVAIVRTPDVVGGASHAHAATAVDLAYAHAIRKQIEEDDPVPECECGDPLGGRS